MRLLLDLTPLDSPTRHRGNGRYLRELARGLAALPPNELRGLDLLALTHLDFTGGFRISDDLTSFHGSPTLPSPTSRDHYHWTYARRLALWRAARRTDARAVHLGDPNATPLLMQLTSCRRILTCHDTIPLRYPRRYMGIRDGGPRLGFAIERRRYRAADLVVAVSDATRNDACSLLRVPEERVVRVYNGVDIERWSNEPVADREATLRKFDLEGRRFLLYVGGPDWHKNIEGLVGALGHVRRQESDIELAWAGHLTPPHRARVEELARQAGVEGALRLLGFVDDDELNVLYRAACAHLLVSRCEGFGLTVVEAMAAGCPVVTTAAGSLAEVAGDAALTVDPEDHEAIAAAVVRLLQEPGLRERLVERGRLRAPTFSLPAQAHATVSAYRRVLENEPNPEATS
jgi:glycosyltransferase involved in cell wall biosynthesis